MGFLRSSSSTNVLADPHPRDSQLESSGHVDRDPRALREKCGAGWRREDGAERSAMELGEVAGEHRPGDTPCAPARMRHAILDGPAIPLTRVAPVMLRDELGF